MGCILFICDACGWRGSFIGIRRVDVVCSCLLCPLVAILSVVFCRLLIFVSDSDASGDHVVETYSSMGLVMSDNTNNNHNTYA